MDEILQGVQGIEDILIEEDMNGYVGSDRTYLWFPNLFHYADHEKRGSLKQVKIVR